MLVQYEQMARAPDLADSTWLSVMFVKRLVVATAVILDHLCKLRRDSLCCTALEALNQLLIDASHGCLKV